MTHIPTFSHNFIFVVLFVHSFFGLYFVAFLMSFSFFAVSLDLVKELTRCSGRSSSHLTFRNFRKYENGTEISRKKCLEDPRIFVESPNCTPFNQYTQKFGEQCPMERKFPRRNFGKLGRTSKGCLFSLKIKENVLSFLIQGNFENFKP